MTIFLTKEEVVAAHYFIMKRMNDEDQAGVRDHNLLESSVHRPMHTVFGEDAYPSLFDKAAVLLESLVKNRCFVNGNKRTAHLVVKSFLRVNGIQLVMEREHAVQFVVDIAEGKCDWKEIADILKQHARFEKTTPGM